jgi:hypothetical protein
VNQKELNHIIQQPQEINAASASELIALCDKYPWFSAPHSLLAHYFARTNDFRKEEWLTRAASRIHNREWLYYFMQPALSTESIEKNVIPISTTPEITQAESTNTEFISPESSNIVAPISEMFIPETSVTESTSITPKYPETPIREFPFKTPQIPNFAPLFQPAEEYDIAKAMGTTFNFEPVEFNPSPDEIESPRTKQLKPYNLEEFISLGLINNEEADTHVSESNESDESPTSEALDFYDWLERKNTKSVSSNSTNINRTNGSGSLEQSKQATTNENAVHETNKPLPNLDKFGLINQFIEKQPSISRPKQEFYSPERAMKRSETFSPAIVTETLANIFRTQGHFEKAIISYQKLQLKFPEKSAYFASLIEQTKKEQNQ